MGSFDFELDDGEIIERERKLKKQSNPDGLAGVKSFRGVEGSL